MEVIGPGVEEAGIPGDLAIHPIGLQIFMISAGIDQIDPVIPLADIWPTILTSLGICGLGAG